MVKTIKSSYLFAPAERMCHARVFAGPGAGKTYFLVNNIKRIVETDDAIVKGQCRKVLCITYTNAAADEVVRRLGGLAKSVEVSTIHAFIFEHIIKPFQRDLKKIMQNDFQIDISCSGVISSQVEGFGVLHGIEKDEVYRFIAKETGNPSLACEYGKKSLGSVEVDNSLFLEDGQKKLRADSTILPSHVVPIKRFVWNVARRLTHDEVLYFGYRILQENPLVPYSLRVKFPFVFVDEFQDTNPLQTLIIELIGAQNTHVYVVGDEAQSIYGFQGAKPSDFRGFEIKGQECLQYCIQDNRRSTGNIVNFCNFIRQSDSTVVQNSLRGAKGAVVHFLIGRTPSVSGAVRDVVDDGGVVLTRTWAAAFNYIEGLGDQQVGLLRTVYNSYFPTTIQLRDEIAGSSGRVSWVRAFKFMFALWEGFRSGSVNRIVLALESCLKVRREALSPVTIRDLVEVLGSVFSGLDERSERAAVEVYESCVRALRRATDSCLGSLLAPWVDPDPMFDENEQERRRDAIMQLSWRSAYKLFTEVFSEKSHYMTVHQAKGLEWGKVFVGVEPSQRMDKTNLGSVYQCSRILGDDVAAEFVRIYYVACSRAKDELYVHIPSGELTRELISSVLESYGTQSGYKIDYDFL